MKKCHFLSLLSSGIFLLSGILYGDYIVPFEEPPFKTGETIIGIEGWDKRLPSASQEETEESARFEKVRWDDYKPAVLLSGASIKTTFPETETLKVEIAMRLAMTYTNRDTTLQQLRILTGAPCGEIVFLSNKEGGGIGLGDGTARKLKVLVPYEDIKPNSYYTIKVTVDYVQRAYDILIEGEKADGSALRFEENGVSFEEPKKTSLSSIAIISANNILVYLKDLSIKSL